MFARVSTLQGPPGQLDDGIKALQEQVFPAAKEMRGFKGILALADRATGKMVGITLWESGDALRESEEAANQLRSDTSSAGGAEIVSVERFEVVADMPV
jgi:heme-degrading monooxygenase HmoA